MTMINLVKVLLFDEQMNHLLLEKAEVLSPLGGQINRADSLTASVRIAMTPYILIQPINQPVWYHIRTEEFRGAETCVHIFYGKLSLSELMEIEKKNNRLVLFDAMNIGKPTKLVAHRLRYLVPMAITFDAVEHKFWPKP